MLSSSRVNRVRRGFARTLEILEDRSVPSVVINEVYVNPPGIDDNREFVELRSLSGGPVVLTNAALVEIQGNPLVTGVIASDVHMSGQITGTNGLALLGKDYNTLGTPWNAVVSPGTLLGDMVSQLNNDNFTLLLVEGYTGFTGQDLDTNDDGTLDITPWANVLDSIGWYDPSISNGKVYSPAILSQTQFTPDAASRFANRDAPQSAAAWYNGEMVVTGGVPDMTRTYDPIRASANLPPGALITPGAVNFLAPNPARITGATFNDVETQRSMVNRAVVTFDQVVTAPSTAFHLQRQSDGAFMTVTATIDNSTGHSVATLSFSGSLVINNSLPDGLFTLTVDANGVANSNGPLDGNGDGVAGGNFQLVGTSANKLFRLFGDADGNGSVTAADFNAFRLTYGTSGPSIFDFDGDGQVSAADFNQFRLRYGVTI